MAEESPVTLSNTMTMFRNSTGGASWKAIRIFTQT